MLNNTSKRRNNNYNRHKKRWRPIVNLNKTKNFKKRIDKYKRKRDYRLKFSKKKNKY